jgi:hypothetical protein
VGIGIRNPQEKLDVSGNTKISGTLNIGALGTGTSVNSLGIDASGNVVSGTTSGGTPTLSEVLTEGNLTNGNDIQTTSGDTIGNVPSLPSGFSGIRFGNDSDGIQIQQYNPSIADPEWGAVKMTLNTHSILVEEILKGAQPFSGIEYGDDYSGDYTNRSLVDKEYVDTNSGSIDGGGSANQMTYWTDIDTITGTSSFTIVDGTTKSFNKTLDSGNFQESFISTSVNEFEMKSEAATNRLRFTHFNNGANFDPSTEFVRFEGTSSSPLAVTNTTRLGSINWYGGHTDGSSAINEGATIQAVATEDWTSTSNATKLNFNVTRISGTTPSVGMTLTGLENRVELDVFGDLYVNSQIEVRTKTNNAPTGTTFTYLCGDGMAQKIDLNDASGDITVTFDDERNGSTYTLLVIQGLTPRNLTFPSGWWLNDSAFDLTTLANDERAFVTITYLNNEYHYS